LHLNSPATMTATALPFTLRPSNGVLRLFEAPCPTASAGVRRVSCSASSETGRSMRSAVSWSRSLSPATEGSIVRGMSENAAAAPNLRPLGIGEILDVGIKVYTRNYLTLWKIVVFVVLPAQILVNAIEVSALPNGALSMAWTYRPFIRERFSRPRYSTKARQRKE